MKAKQKETKEKLTWALDAPAWSHIYCRADETDVQTSRGQGRDTNDV